MQYKNKDDNNIVSTTISFGNASLIYSNNNKLCINTTVPTTEIKFELTEPKICKCCGAAMHNKICEYCGVEYNYKEV